MADLFEQAAELPDYEFRPTDKPVLVTDESGALVKVPKRALGRAQAEGFRPLGGDELAQRQRRVEAQERQAGVVPALIAGTEEAASTATFGLTDWLAKKAAGIAGVSEAEYLAAREERQLGSPIASGLGTAAGLILPAIATAGAAAPAAGAAVAARTAAAATPIARVMQAGRAVTAAAETALAAEAGAGALARTAARVLPKVAGGAVEGALWGTGEGVRESILGKTDSVSEAVAAHVGTDALLFGAMNGGLGLIEGALPTVLRGAKKALDATYERTPFFGRRALLEAAVAAPEKTGVAAETARKLYAEREALAALDAKLGGALDVLATTTPERIDQVLARVADVEAIAGLKDPKKVLAAIVTAPVEQATAVLDALPGIAPLMEASKTAVPELLAAPVDQLAAIVRNAEGVAALEQQVPGTFRTLLAAPAEQATAALSNVNGLLALEDQARGNIKKLLAAPADRIEAALGASYGLAELETLKAGAIDSVLAAPAERSIEALKNIDGIATLQRYAPGDALSELLNAPIENASGIMRNAEAVATLERTKRGALKSLMDTAPERALLIAENGAGIASLEREVPGTVRRLLEASEADAQFFATRAPQIAALEVDAKGAFEVMRLASNEQRDWVLSRSADIIAMERELPGSLNSFRAFVTGPDGAWVRQEADNLLDNWTMIMRNPNERSRVVANVIEEKSAQFKAGQNLQKELYTAAKADRNEALRAIGQPGGPPSLDVVQKAAGDAAALVEETASRMLSDPLSYEVSYANSMAALSKEMQGELVLKAGPQTLKAGPSKAGAILADPVQVYDRLVTARTQVGNMIGALRKIPESERLVQQSKALVEANKVYGALSETLKDTAVFGESAAVKASLDEIIGEWKQITKKGSPLRKFFMEEVTVKGQKVAEISESKVNQWVNQIGDARTSASIRDAKTKTEAFHELTSVLQRMVDVGQTSVPSVVKGAVDIGEAEIRTLVEKSIASSADLEKRALYSRIYNQLAPTKASERAAGTLGFRTGSVNLGGYGHGAATAGTSGVPIAAPIGDVLVAERAAMEATVGREAQLRELQQAQERVRLGLSRTELSAREAELVRRSRILAGAPVDVAAEADALAAEALPGGAAFAESVARRTLGVVPGGGAVTGIADLLRTIPRQQWQVTARVRGMVAAEKRARDLGAAIERGASSLLRVAGKGTTVIAAPIRREERREELERKAERGVKAAAKRRAETVDAMRQVQLLRDDPEAFADHMDAQGFAVASDLPEIVQGVSGVTLAATQVLAEAVPKQPQGQLDKWEPSNADVARFSRVRAALSRPTSVLDRARDGSLTQEEIRAVERVYPQTMVDIRAAIQAVVSSAVERDEQIPRERLPAIEAILGYPLATGSSPESVRRAQAVFSGARRGETAKADVVRPLPGAANVTLSNRYMTPQQAAGARRA